MSMIELNNKCCMCLNAQAIVSYEIIEGQEIKVCITCFSKLMRGERQEEPKMKVLRKGSKRWTS
jgi:hypothetical protein